MRGLSFEHCLDSAHICQPAERVRGSVRLFTREDVDRIFEKQIKFELDNKEAAKKRALEWYRLRWKGRRCQLGFENDRLVQLEISAREHKEETAYARAEAREIQSHLERNFTITQYVEALKDGVLDGSLEIREDNNGFVFITPPDKIDAYVSQHPRFRNAIPAPDYLNEGVFLLDSVVDWEKERASFIRNSLVEEFQAETPSELMLVDMAVSNYIRLMHAARLEMESLRYADNRMEMFQVMMEGVEPYLHSCQNELLRVLGALKARRYGNSMANTLTYETYSRTRVNVQNWGLLLLLALAEITEQKDREIGISEIKEAMAKHLKGLGPDVITNSSIGYALRDYGFKEKIHLNDGNHYDIPRERVLTLLNEQLKA